MRFRFAVHAIGGGILGAALLSGCGLRWLAGPERVMPATQFALGVTLESAIDTSVEPSKALVPASAKSRELPPIRLLGRAFVPQTLDGVANLQDGYVSGSPVRIFDASTGRLIAQSVTYYDGSFLVDIPLLNGQRAVLVTSELVGKGEGGKSVRLMAPTLLVAGTAEQRVVLSPGSTALVAFLSNLALEQTGQVAPESLPEPSLEGDKPDHVSTTLSGLIAVFGSDAQERFAQLAEAAPELKEAASLNGLQTGIQRYVGRLTRSAGKPSKP